MSNSDFKISAPSSPNHCRPRAGRVGGVGGGDGSTRLSVRSQSAPSSPNHCLPRAGRVGGVGGGDGCHTETGGNRRKKVSFFDVSDIDFNLLPVAPTIAAHGPAGLGVLGVETVPPVSVSGPNLLPVAPTIASRGPAGLGVLGVEMVDTETGGNRRKKASFFVGKAVFLPSARARNAQALG